MTYNKMMSDLVMSLGPLDVTLNRIEDVNISDHKIIDFEIKINWYIVLQADGELGVGSGVERRGSNKV